MIVLIIYAWTLLWFFWKVPGWLFYLHVGEILTTLAYALANNFAESLVAICGPLFLALILPTKWVRDVFIARGASLCIAGLGYLILLAYQFNDKDTYPSAYLKPLTLLLVATAIAALVYLCGRVRPLRKGLEVLADRASIFAYIMAPLSIVSLVVVVVRSLMG